jgi:hypothetical protein
MTTYGVHQQAAFGVVSCQAYQGESELDPAARTTTVTAYFKESSTVWHLASGSVSDAAILHLEKSAKMGHGTGTAQGAIARF